MSTTDYMDLSELIYKPQAMDGPRCYIRRN